MVSYLIFYKQESGKGFTKPVSNRKLLSEITGISYWTLTNHFIREGRVWVYYEDKGVYILRFGEIERGRQRISKR